VPIDVFTKEMTIPAAHAHAAVRKRRRT
jgi:hypothetical protein